MNKPDKLEDAIYSSPIGSTTAWRCIGCGTAIAKMCAPCKCPGFEKKVESGDKNHGGSTP